MAFKNFEVKRPEFSSLDKGRHICTIARVEELNSFESDFRGTIKVWDPEQHWTDPSSQIGVTFVAVDGSGAITHRFHEKAYRKYDKLTDEQLEAIEKKYGKAWCIEPYVVVKNKEGKLVRLTDPEGSKACDNIMSSLALALGYDEGDRFDSVVDMLNQAREEKRLVEIDVQPDEYQGRSILKVQPRFWAVKQTAPAVQEEADAEFK